MKKRLVAVDLDGTMIDTAKINEESYRRALAEKGFPLDSGEYQATCFGKHYRDFLPGLMGGDPSEEDLQFVHERKKELYASCMPFGRRNEELYAILTALKATGEWYTALVTTGNPRNTGEILRNFGCYDLFDLILTSADVQRNKPDPEGYRKAMAHFGVTPEDTLIFEDSETGIAAAEAAGAKVFLIDRF